MGNAELEYKVQEGGTGAVLWLCQSPWRVNVP